ncbi:hypothetical protein CIB48_g3720 [Xylaria polymorpha]|nr:hypothetical protein CIB48_g3720 [Xylaria polymorpha]
MSSSTSGGAPTEGASQPASAPPPSSGPSGTAAVSTDGDLITQAPPTATAMEVPRTLPSAVKVHSDGIISTYGTQNSQGDYTYIQVVHHVPPVPLGERVRAEISETAVTASDETDHHRGHLSVWTAALANAGYAPVDYGVNCDDDDDDDDDDMVV